MYCVCTIEYPSLGTSCKGTVPSFCCLLHLDRQIPTVLPSIIEFIHIHNVVFASFPPIAKIFDFTGPYMWPLRQSPGIHVCVRSSIRASVHHAKVLYPLFAAPCYVLIARSQLSPSIIDFIHICNVVFASFPPIAKIFNDFTGPYAWPLRQLAYSIDAPLVDAPQSQSRSAMALLPGPALCLMLPDQAALGPHESSFLSPAHLATPPYVLHWH